MKYKYQTHIHTSPCSACATMTTEELAESLHKGGYSGCVLTNHFYSGNSGIDRTLQWNDFIEHYVKDYFECKKAAEKYDLDICFGIEEHLFGGLEILCYGITPQFLYDNPYLQNDHSPKTWYDALHNVGAVCIQAHPFRDRYYITKPDTLPFEYIDGIEVYNYSNRPEENRKAEKIAQNNPELILMSGADAHSGELSCFAGIETNIRITNEKMLSSVLKSKNYRLIR